MNILESHVSAEEGVAYALLKAVASAASKDYGNLLMTG